jgi:hypothetical protein
MIQESSGLKQGPSNKLKQRLKGEGSEAVTICHQLKLLEKDENVGLNEKPMELNIQNRGAQN